MPAYLIVTAVLHDREAFLAEYGAAAARLVQSLGGRYRLMRPDGQVLEGEGPERVSVVIEEWPDRQTVLNFWNSPEYAEVRKMREGLADCRVVLVESEAPI
ncbi:MAG: DUF1330 domain-containing protein [Brevundimonas sp.]|uniref:DUF1330 domain-containing protein n=1 Tax=Brevundimonas sp. TaxID=1871086 RepID=UPI0025C448BF|nr:DUF1330 domain-containing protein [Brevundimonas sp.]MBX3478457.1 DUF1330 domain-containing protein [Brevundimonas sp.]